MTRIRFGLVAALLALPLMLGGCMGRPAALRQAQSYLSGVRDEASMTVGPGYQVDVRLSGVNPIAPDSRLPLSAYEADYHVVVTSSECTAFRQEAGASRFFGPGAAPRAGGLHDWTLFRSLATWDSSRRVAFLKYVAAHDNQYISYASLLDGSFPGGEWVASTPLHTKILALGAKRGLSSGDLAWVGIGENCELLAFDRGSRTWSLLARRAGEGPLVAQ